MSDDSHSEMLRQYMLLWQEKTRSMMEDERFLDMLLEMMIPPRSAAAQKGKQQATDAAQKPQHGKRPDTATPYPAALSPDVRADALAELAGRIARLEKRVRELEAEREGAPKPAKKQPAARARKPVPQDER